MPLTDELIGRMIYAVRFDTTKYSTSYNYRWVKLTPTPSDDGSGDKKNVFSGYHGSSIPSAKYGEIKNDSGTMSYFNDKQLVEGTASTYEYTLDTPMYINLIQKYVPKAAFTVLVDAQ